MSKIIPIFPATKQPLIIASKIFDVRLAEAFTHVSEETRFSAKQLEIIRSLLETLSDIKTFNEFKQRVDEKLACVLAATELSPIDDLNRNVIMREMLDLITTEFHAGEGSNQRRDLPSNLI